MFQSARARTKAGVHQDAGASVVRLDRAHAADDRAVVHQPGELRKMFADLDARYGGADRPELTAITRARLEIERILVAGTARHPQEDARLVACPIGHSGVRVARENTKPARYRRSTNSRASQAKQV